MKWTIQPPNWETLAGRTLDAFFKAVSETLPSYDLPLTIFGSAPIQLCLDAAFTSADVDIMVIDDGAALREIATKAGVGRAGTLRPAFGVQICPSMLFRPTPHYLQRAHIEIRHGLRIIVPHLRDILIGKLHRSRLNDQHGLAPKDLRAFQRVRELCEGHPTKEEILEDLVSCEPYFRPTYDGSINAFRFNADDVLNIVYGHGFDLKRDILDAAQSASMVSVSAEDGTVAEMVRHLRPDRM